MQRIPQNDRKHLAMWLAVGGTMTVIVALWVLILPSQLAQSGQSDTSFSRWYTARANQTQQPKQSFADVMAEQKAKLDALSQKQVSNNNIDAKNVQKIDDLRARIEAATQNANAPTANVNGTVNAATNTNAPKKP